KRFDSGFAMDSELETLFQQGLKHQLEYIRRIVRRTKRRRRGVRPRRDGEEIRLDPLRPSRDLIGLNVVGETDHVLQWRVHDFELVAAGADALAALIWISKLEGCDFERRPLGARGCHTKREERKATADDSAHEFLNSDLPAERRL